MVRDTITLDRAVSVISGKYLLEFCSEYYIPDELHPELPGPGDKIFDFPEGKVGVSPNFSSSPTSVSPCHNFYSTFLAITKYIYPNYPL